MVAEAVHPNRSPSLRAVRIATPPGTHIVAQSLRGEHHDLVALLVKVLGHFQLSGGVEADDQAAVGLQFDLLAGWRRNSAARVTTTEPQAPHVVIDIIGAIGITQKQMFSSGPTLGDALAARKEFLP